MKSLLFHQREEAAKIKNRKPKLKWGYACVLLQLAADYCLLKQSLSDSRQNVVGKRKATCNSTSLPEF
jgi:hypothetical protein